MTETLTDISELRIEGQYAADCGMRIGYYALEAADTIEKLRIALRNLSNEVLGSMPLMEPLCRREFGNTNYAILIQRAQEARALLPTANSCE